MLVALVIFLIVRSKHVFSGQQLTCIDEQEKQLLHSSCATKLKFRGNKLTFLIVIEPIKPMLPIVTSSVSGASDVFFPKSFRLHQKLTLMTQYSQEQLKNLKPSEARLGTHQKSFSTYWGQNPSLPHSLITFIVGVYSLSKITRQIQHFTRSVRAKEPRHEVVFICEAIFETRRHLQNVGGFSGNEQEAQTTP